MDWRSLVKTVAPVLGTALGGPLGGAATKFLAGKILGEDATEADLEEWVAGASPEQLLQLKQLDQQFEKEMRALDVDVMRLDQADRDSARGLAKNDMRPHIVISGIYTAMYGFALYFLLSGQVQIPPEQNTLAISVMSILTAAQGQIMNFWFGSSSGSKEKTAKIGG